MNKIIFLGGLILLAGSIYYFKNQDTVIINNSSSIVGSKQNISETESEKITIVAKNLDTVWGMAFLPDKSLLFTERVGTVKRLMSDKSIIELAKIDNVKESGEGGLLGIALHPDFDANKYVYLYYTYSDASGETLNRVVRMTYSDNPNQLINEEIIVDAIPGASNHNGGRIKFGPDKNLYIGTGDAQNSSQAQNTNSMAGKTLRVTPEGKSVESNPFKNNVFSYGHRNVQGLAWDDLGNLWATEHGRSGIRSGLDELNLIEIGKNYGWPDIEGDETADAKVTAKQNSGADDTWAPAGITFFGQNLYFAGLRGSAVYRAKINGTDAEKVDPLLKNEFGRIRDVILGPDNILYLSTSNKDGRGTPKSGDDKIIRYNPN